MTRRTLYFEIENSDTYSKEIWVAQAEKNGWKVLSPQAEELGFVCEDGATYAIYSVPFGLKGVRRNTIEKAVYFLAAELRIQEKLKKKIQE